MTNEHDVSILDFNMDNVPELAAVAADEYELMITQVEVKDDRNGNKGMRVVMEIIEQPESYDVSDWFALPRPDDTEKQRIRRLNRLRNFLRACNYADEDMQGIDTEDLKGRRCWAHLVVEESEQYGRQNNVKKYTRVA